MKVFTDKMMSTLVVGINRGDEKDFASLYRLYHVPLCLFALRIVRDESVAEDLVEEAFVKLWEQRRTFNSSNHLIAFLYQSIRHSAYDYVKIQNRSQARHEVFASEYYQHSEEDYLNDIVKTELRASIFRAIADLPPQVHTIITKSYFDGKTNQELADEMGLSIQTIKNHKYRGLVLLKEKLLHLRISVFIVSLSLAAFAKL